MARRTRPCSRTCTASNATTLRLSRLLARSTGAPSYGDGRNAGTCVAGESPDIPLRRRSCWHAMPRLRCFASISTATESAHPDIARVMSIAAAIANALPTTDLCTLFISLSNVKHRELAGFQQATSPSGAALAQSPKGPATSYKSLSIRAGKLCNRIAWLYPPQSNYLTYYYTRSAGKVKRKVARDNVKYYV